MSRARRSIPLPDDQALSGKSRRIWLRNSKCSRKVLKERGANPKLPIIYHLEGPKMGSVKSLSGKGLLKSGSLKGVSENPFSKDGFRNGFSKQLFRNHFQKTLFEKWFWKRLLGTVPRKGLLVNAFPGEPFRAAISAI